MQFNRQPALLVVEGDRQRSLTVRSMAGIIAANKVDFPDPCGPTIWPHQPACRNARSMLPHLGPAERRSRWRPA